MGNPLVDSHHKVLVMQNFHTLFLTCRANSSVVGDLRSHDARMADGRWRGDQGPVSISDKTSYRKISWNLEAARLVVKIIASLWNMTGASAAVLPRCLSNFRAIAQFQIQISRLRDFRRSYDKTSYRISLKPGPELYITDPGAWKLLDGWDLPHTPPVMLNRLSDSDNIE